MIVPLSSAEATVTVAGGKGAGLARLIRSGVPVPSGFLVSTAVYETYLAENGVAPLIVEALNAVSSNDVPRLEQASETIRNAFSTSCLSVETTHALLSAYSTLRESLSFDATPLVAVRSSATSEDGPELSFAGQYETYLNVQGESELLAAVVNCWSSLWTPRAISYRLRNGVSHDGLGIAVVVQQMVLADVSGVLFTANPLTGRRSEMVIDATRGSGDDYVGGHANPERYVIDRVSRRTLEVEGVAGDRPLLTEEKTDRLRSWAERIEEFDGAPQDIEWSFAGDQLVILQARPITSLFPLPVFSGLAPTTWISVAAIQGLSAPLTPLGRDVCASLANAFVAHLFGTGGLANRGAANVSKDVLDQAGERLWVNLDTLARTCPLGWRPHIRRLARHEPRSGRIIRELSDDNALPRSSGRMWVLLKTMPVWLPLAVISLGGGLRSTLFPASSRRQFDRRVEDLLARMAVPVGRSLAERLRSVITFLRTCPAQEFPRLLLAFVRMITPAAISLRLLAKLCGDQALALETTRSLDGNVTVEMDLALWTVSQTIATSGEALEVFREESAETIARRYVEETLPGEAQAALAGFLNSYGMRCVGEIDIGQSRWREDPTQIIRSIKSYLTIPPEAAPDVQFESGKRAAVEAEEQIAARVSRQSFGRLKNWLARAATRRVRLLMGARETPKFALVKMLGIARAALEDVGAQCVAVGYFESSNDLAFLHLDELERLAHELASAEEIKLGTKQEEACSQWCDWKKLVLERRKAYNREQRRRRIPRVLVSDGRTFYDSGAAEESNGHGLKGVPVSPGVVEGKVRVVFDPRDSEISAGEILVCPGTDPAWTPMFMAAAGLITEVGGLMTHGSVVAREYGIPAVVSVRDATTRLQDGQQVRLDGTTGTITILESEAAREQVMAVL